MPLLKQDTRNRIRGSIIPNGGQRSDCQTVIASLTFADLTRGSGTLHTHGIARLDMQGRTAQGEANLAVQIGNGTVAQALIASSVLRTNDPRNQIGAANGAISVLNQSLDTQTIWNLSGSLPSTATLKSQRAL